VSKEKEKIIFIIIVGTPAEGFLNYGPFDSNEEAISWAETNIDEDPWWVDVLLRKLVEK
jgi:hypothetical protein